MTKADGSTIKPARVTPILRALVVVVTLAVATGALAIFDTDRTVSRLTLLDVVLEAISNSIMGLASGLGLVARTLIGVLFVAPIEHSADVILARPDALSVQSLIRQAIAATLMTVILPWIDPPRLFWRWAASGSVAAQRLKLALVLLAWAAWLLAAALGCTLIGYAVVASATIVIGTSAEPWSELERAALGFLIVLVVGLATVIGFVFKGPRERRIRLWRSVGFAVAYGGGFFLLNVISVVSTALQIIAPNSPGAELVLPYVKEFLDTPFWYFIDALGIWLLVSLLVLPLAFGILTLDDDAVAKGKRSIASSIGLVLALILLGIAWGGIMFVIAGSLFLAPGSGSQADIIGKVCGGGIGLAAAIWLIRRRRLSQPTAAWPAKKPVYAALPDAVADAVNDAAKRQS